MQNWGCFCVVFRIFKTLFDEKCSVLIRNRTDDSALIRPANFGDRLALLFLETGLPASASGGFPSQAWSLPRNVFVRGSFSLAACMAIFGDGLARLFLETGIARLRL